MKFTAIKNLLSITNILKHGAIFIKNKISVISEYRFIFRKFITIIVLITSISIVPDSMYLSPGKSVSLKHQFSLMNWELVNIPSKWFNRAKTLMSVRKLNDKQRKTVITEYLETTKLLKHAKNQLDGLSVVGKGTSINTRDKIRLDSLKENFRELNATKQNLRPIAEEIIESELNKLLLELGFGYRFSLLIPPVDLRFEELPTVLFISRRDKIEVIEQVILEADLDLTKRNSIEKLLFDKFNYSALVDNIGGLSTYPTLVSDQGPLRSILRTAAHEWIHAYLFFKPLGWNWNRSANMFSLNETIAELAGNELGDELFVQLGGDLSIAQSRYVPRGKRNTSFTKEMKETRKEVDRLLDDGKIIEAEEYMKQRWWRLRLAGYPIRKLNQAYFAFHGRYAEGPTSISPIGPQVRALREIHSDIRSFLKTVENVSSYEQFIKIIQDKNIKY